MSIRVALNHKTSYSLRPAYPAGPPDDSTAAGRPCRTPILSYSLHVSPANHFLNWQQDPNGNYLARVVFNEKVARFDVEVDMIAELTVINPFDFFLEPDANETPVLLRCLVGRGTVTLLGAGSARAAAPRFRRLGRPNAAPHHRFSGRIESAATARDRLRHSHGTRRSECEETLELRRGSCRDSAWLLVQILRHLGLAARFTSGYLIQLKPDVKPLDGPAGTDQDFTDLHAWTEVYLPGAGWVGLDPTSGLLAGEGHIPLACTPNPSAAAPISGHLRSRGNPLRVRDVRDAHSRGSARHETLHGNAMGVHRVVGRGD